MLNVLCSPYFYLLALQIFSILDVLFHGIEPVQSNKGTYKIPFSNAAKECAAKGMVLASKSQLQFAFNQGYAKCACGWLSDKKAYFPTQNPSKACGKRGLNYCGNDLSNTYNAFCYTKGKHFNTFR